MKKTAVAFFSFFIYGILGAFAYSFMITQSFEPQTGFLIFGAPLYINIALAALFIIFAAFYCLSYKKGSVGKLSDLLLAGDSSCLTLKIIIGFFMLFGAFLSIFDQYGRFTPLNMCNSIFIFISAVSILFIAFAQKKGAFDEFHYYLAMIPVLWSCFLFMEIFKLNGGNPVLFSYIFQLFSGLFIMLSSYRFAALFFRKRGVRGFIILTLLAYYFSAAFYGGQLISLIWGEKLSAGQLAVAFSSLGISAFLLINASIIAPKAQVCPEQAKGDLK